MAYLDLVHFTQKAVSSSKVLQKGGSVGPRTYIRRGKNVIVSPGLKRRMGEAAEAMIANCRLNDACVPKGKEHLVGRPVPGKPGKVYVACTEEERTRRLLQARECAIAHLRKAGPAAPPA